MPIAQNKVGNLKALKYHAVQVYIYFGTHKISDTSKCYKFCSIMVRLLPPAYAVEVMFSSCLCVCVCLSVCLSVCVSVRATTFEPVDIETSFLVW